MTGDWCNWSYYHGHLCDDNLGYKPFVRYLHRLKGRTQFVVCILEKVVVVVISLGEIKTAPSFQPSARNQENVTWNGKTWLMAIVPNCGQTEFRFTVAYLCLTQFSSSLIILLIKMIPEITERPCGRIWRSVKFVHREVVYRPCLSLDLPLAVRRKSQRSDEYQMWDESKK